MSKKSRDLTIRLYGFPVKLKNVPMFRFEGKDEPDIDYEKVSEDLFFELLRRPIRLTGNHIRFLRKHLGLTQKDMENILGMKQANFSKIEAKGNDLAFQSDANLIALRVELARVKLERLKQKRRIGIMDVVHPASEYKNPGKVLSLNAA